MYRALIADDEEIIRRGIARFLSMDKEIEVVGQAEDGETALELAGRCRPDLLFVDINMPFLNGLDFVARLNPQDNDFLTIIITGYDDFAYVQKALRLGVFDYQLKPIMEESFFSMLARAKQKREEMRRAKNQFEESRDFLTEKVLNRWFTGACGSAQAAEELKRMGVRLPDPYAVTVVRPAEKKTSETLRHPWEESLLLYAADNISREVFAPFPPVFSTRGRPGELILLTGAGKGAPWERAAEQLRQLLEQSLSVDAEVDRQTGSEAAGIPAAYQTAVQELQRRGGCSALVRDAQAYIRQNFADANFSLQEAARFVHVSPQHLSRVFRSEMDAAFWDYVMTLRIRMAEELLRGDDKIYEIAQKTGYSSQHYFSNAFKRVLGISPVDYRKNCRRAEQERAH